MVTIEKAKRTKPICRIIGECLVALAPLALTIISAVDKDLNVLDFSNPLVYVFWLLSMTSLIVGIFTLKNTIVLGKDVHDVYIPRYLDNTVSASKHKYDEIFNSIHNNEIKPECNVLLYDGHHIIKNMIERIKNLVHEITGIELSNISVNFIYKYQWDDEHWQTIDGTASCSIGTLDKIVNEGPSIYHYISANNYEYVFLIKNLM